MSLLTTEEYKAIAAGLSFPTQAFIDGHFRPAIGGKTFDTINPATGDVLAKVAACGPEDVDLAVAKARVSGRVQSDIVAGDGGERGPPVEVYAEEGVSRDHIPSDRVSRREVHDNAAEGVAAG